MEGMTRIELEKVRTVDGVGKGGVLRPRDAATLILLDRIDEFPAPEQSVKRFATVIARRPAC